eukprot:scaffold2340_cov292-Chaetoceros_neogracile.AAC.1
MAVGSTLPPMNASPNNLDTQAKPVHTLLTAYMEVYRHLEGDTRLQAMQGDWIDRMNIERFPINHGDLTMENVRSLTIIMCRGLGHTHPDDMSRPRAIGSVLRRLSAKTSGDKRASIVRSIWDSCEEVDFRSLFILQLFDRLRAQLSSWLANSEDFTECCYPIPLFTRGLIPSENSTDFSMITHFDKKAIMHWIGDQNPGFVRPPTLMD